MKISKKLVALILSFIMLVPFACFTVLADEDVSVTFSSSFFEAGEKNEVIVEGYDSESLRYVWYVDGKEVINSDSYYIPSDFELESYISVDVFDGNKKLGSVGSYFSRLPVCYIDTDEAEITKAGYIDANMVIQGNSEYNDPKQLYDGKIEIKGRGNTSWYAPKKPYKIKLDSKSNLFNMGKNKHWVLLANYYDQSSLRNMLSYNMSGEMGLNYQQSVWVNVIMNGKCIGVYQLCEHVRLGKDRINIFDWESAGEDAASAIGKANGLSKADISSLEDQMVENLSWVTDNKVVFNETEYTVSDYYEIPEANGGFLYEADTHYDEVSKFTTSNGLLMNIGSPEFLNSNSEMFDYAKSYFQAVEDAVYSDDFCTEYNGEKVRYTDLIDLDSFAIGWIVNDLFGNVDYPYKSTYYYKDLNGKLYYGPVWDMDYSGDNATDVSFCDFRSIKDTRRRFMSEMTEDPVFVKRARELYWEIRSTYLYDLLKEGGIYDKDVSYLKEALRKNDIIWNYTYTSDEDSAAFKNWLKLKVQWLDAQYMSDDTLYQALHPEKYTAGLFEYDENEPVKLEVTSLPSKTYYLPGEKLDLTGVQLLATLRSGETKIVEPDYYVVSMKGYKRFEATFDGIAETEGKKTVDLYYKNVRASFNINVYSDSVDSVTNLINDLPDEVSASDYNDIYFARNAFNRLSAVDQSRIKNYDKLENAEKSINLIIDNMRQNGECILNAYYDGVFRFGSTNAIVVETLYSPKTRAIVLLYPTGSTRTINSAMPNVSVYNDGTVQTWVIYCVTRADYYDVFAKGASNVSYRLKCADFENESTLVKRIDSPSVITPEIENEQYVYPAFAEFSAVTSKNVESMKIRCNNKEFTGTENLSGDNKVWTFYAALTDTGVINVQYIYTYLGKEYTFSVEDECFLREQVKKADPKIVSVSIAQEPYKLDYYYRAKVNTDGLKLLLTYDDGSTKIVEEGFTCTPDKFTKTGDQTVTVNYMGYSVKYQVKVSYSFVQMLIRIFLFGWIWY